MANVSNVTGYRTGTQAFTQAYLSRQVVSTLASILPILYLTLAIDGNKKGMYGIGIPDSGSLISRIPSARAREKQIYGAEAYQPLIHSTLSDIGDGKNIGMRDTMPSVGGGGGTGAQITATLGTNPYVTGFNVLAGGTGYSSSAAVTVTGGTTGGTATATLTIVGGVITAAAVNSSGSGYTATPAVSVAGTGTSQDQHFARPFVKWVEFADPILVYKKPMRRQKNLLKGASSGEREQILASLIKEATDDARIVHMQRWARELWGVTTTSDVGPTSQSAEVWDHMLSMPSACHTTNTYAGVDRSLAASSFWLGKRDTTHKAAVLEDLFNQANYTNGCKKIGMGIKIMLCGATLFPQFQSQALARGGQIIWDGTLPQMAMFGAAHPIVRYMDMFVVYDPTCPDKAETDPRTGSAYTKNAVFGANLDSFTFAFEPEAKFSVDEPFDLTKTDGGKDAWKSQIRTEMLGVCEAPAGNFYWEDVG